MLARRTGRIDSSGIRKVFDLARAMENPVNFSIGQPHFDVPDELKAAAVSAIEDGKNRYTVTQGTVELRDAVERHVRDRKGMSGGKTLITSGVSGGILLACLALVDDGDEVLVPDPYFVMYKHLVNLLGGNPVFVDTYPDFRLTEQVLEAKVTDRTKVLFMNSPANPTGSTYSDEEVGIAVRFAAKHDLVIISDEIYDEYIYEDDVLPTPAARYEKTLLLGGFSKTYSMTGWRIGYAVGPDELIDAMTTIQQFSFVCAPSFAQEAALRAFDTDVGERIADYKRRRDLIYDGLRERYEIVKPKGAFYMFPKAPWGSGEEFVSEAIKRNVLIIPGGVFSERDTHFRISFTAPDDEMKRGIDVLNDLAKRR
jgi:aspartate/methionine/tyrosine aminotransferase